MLHLGLEHHRTTTTGCCSVLYTCIVKTTNAYIHYVVTHTYTTNSQDMKPRMARSRRSKHPAAVVLACTFLAWTSRTFAFGPAAPPQAPEKETSGASGVSDDIETSLLLGREAWQFNQWRAETDDIRGGSSTASLKGLTDSSGQAEFLGVLSEVENAFAGLVF